MSFYAWKITEVTVEDADETDQTALGVSGPKDSDFESLPTDTESEFEVFDSDDNSYCKGLIRGEFYGFEPLDDYAEGMWGCTSIKIDGEPL